MKEVTAALVGAFIGVIGGVAGGGFAALASLRASQTAARAPVAVTLHEVAKAVVRFRATKGTSEHGEAQRDFQRCWSLLSIQQRILCPSKRIEGLVSLVLAATQDKSADPDQLLHLSGQALDKISRMVGAHSLYIFRWRARSEETAIIRSWLANPESQILSQALRLKLDALAR